VQLGITGFIEEGFFEGFIVGFIGEGFIKRFIGGVFLYLFFVQQLII